MRTGISAGSNNRVDPPTAGENGAPRPHGSELMQAESEFVGDSIGLSTAEAVTPNRSADFSFNRFDPESTLSIRACRAIFAECAWPQQHTDPQFIPHAQRCGSLAPISAAKPRAANPWVIPRKTARIARSRSVRRMADSKESDVSSKNTNEIDSLKAAESNRSIKSICDHHRRGARRSQEG